MTDSKRFLVPGVGRDDLSVSVNLNMSVSDDIHDLGGSVRAVKANIECTLDDSFRTFL